MGDALYHPNHTAEANIGNIEANLDEYEAPLASPCASGDDLAACIGKCVAAIDEVLPATDAVYDTLKKLDDSMQLGSVAASTKKSTDWVAV